eukprot:6193175-Pyramimonas_sp.AAC.2
MGIFSLSFWDWCPLCQRCDLAFAPAHTAHIMIDKYDRIGKQSAHPVTLQLSSAGWYTTQTLPDSAAFENLGQPMKGVKVKKWARFTNYVLVHRLQAALHGRWLEGTKHRLFDAPPDADGASRRRAPRWSATSGTSLT